MNENEIRELLGQGIGEEPPIVGGPAAVFAGARARAVRTRVVTGALSVVAVLGVTAGAVALAGPGRPGRGAGVVAGATATSVSSTPSTAPTASALTSGTPSTTTTTPPNTTTPTPLSKLQGSGLDTHRAPAPVPGSGQVLIDSRSSAMIVKLRLRSGLLIANYEGQDSYQPKQLGVETIANMSVGDGTGKLTLLSVHLVQNGRSINRVTDCTTEQELDSDRISDCRAEAEPDGSVVLSYSLRDDASGTAPVTQSLRSNEAIRVFPNGCVLSISATNYYVPWNSTNNQTLPAKPSFSIPLLSVDELAGMVIDPRWGLTVPAQFAQQAKHDLVPYTDNTQH